MDNAFEYAQTNALETEDNYKYTGKDETCKFNSDLGVVTVSEFVDVEENNGDALLEAVAQQPVSVAINAGSLAVQLYSNGVITSEALCGHNLDHGVLAVGYGNDGKNNYWIVKNSWGASWGEKGYFRIKRVSKGAGVCGINMAASYPIVE